MDNSTMISIIRKLLLAGDSVSDDAITFYIGLVKDIITAQCDSVEYPSKMDNIAINVVIAYINRRGMEGISNLSEGEASKSVNSMINAMLEEYKVVFEKYRRDNFVSSSKLRFI